MLERIRSIFRTVDAARSLDDMVSELPKPSQVAPTGESDPIGAQGDAKSTEATRAHVEALKRQGKR